MVLPWEKLDTESAVLEPSSNNHRNHGYTAMKVANPINFADLDAKSIERESRSAFRNKEFDENGGQTTEQTDDMSDDFDFYERHLVCETLQKEMSWLPAELSECQHLLDDRLIQNTINGLKFSKLNPLQTRSLPILIEGHHLLVMAPTGIGKTAAFLLPAIQKVINWKKEESGTPSTKPSPSVLILNNTRNLALQSLHRASVHLGINTTRCIEEVWLDCYTSSSSRMRQKCDIAIATIGKLKELFDQDQISLENLRFLVIDEADNMISMEAFGAQIEMIYDKLPDTTKEKLQVCFFSATYDDCDYGIQITELQSKLLRGEPPMGISVPPRPGHINQRIYRVPDIDRNDASLANSDFIQRMNIVKALIDQDLKRTNCQKSGPFEETIGIFVETVKKVNVVVTMLNAAGYKFAPLSRLIVKSTQSKNLEDLRQKNIQGVVCTNIMARGIDVSSIKHIIVLEMAKDFNTYRHRIGRTGRAGHGGTASVLINMSYYRATEQRVLEQLDQFLHANNQPVPDWLADFANNYRTQRQELLDSCGQ